MGITILNALALIDGGQRGVNFAQTLTLGRLECHMSAADLLRIARLLPQDSDFVEAVRQAAPPKYADDFFRALGASTIEELDASHFDGASIAHDLNEPLPAHLHGRFTAVVDGGTLEHVFNAPEAFRSAMDALQVGGHFLASVPANNYCGHGFYQFSAEFFFELFASANGFEMEQLLVAPAYAAGKWLDGPAFEVGDPRRLRTRVEIEGRRKMLFLVRARKLQQRKVFAAWPQQSGYEEAWQAGPPVPQPPPPRPGLFQRAWRWVFRRAGGVRRVVTRARERRIWRRKCERNPALRPYHWNE